MGVLWNRSGTVEFDNAAVRAPGALAYFYEGNTTTPLATYMEASESTPHDHPVEADANGRWPTVFIPYITSYDVKITTAGGTQLSYPTEIPNPNPVEAAAITADASELIQTGDIIFSPKTGTRDGFVRCNGSTIGSVASGAGERANDDTDILFAFLWNNFANTILPVFDSLGAPVGRGGSAATDFAANKSIALFDMRMGIPVGVDDMGNSAASRSSEVTFFTGNSTTGGSQHGGNNVNQQSLTVANLPSVTPAGTIAYTPAGTVSQPSFTGTPVSHTPAGTVTRPTITVANGTNIAQAAVSAATVTTGGSPQIATTTITASLDADPVFTGTGTTITATGTVSQPSFTGTLGAPTFTGTPFGSGTTHNVCQYGILGTYFQKL